MQKQEGFRNSAAEESWFVFKESGKIEDYLNYHSHQYGKDNSFDHAKYKEEELEF